MILAFAYKTAHVTDQAQTGQNQDAKRENSES